MIVTRLNGGLGNQMFQYAIAKKLALKFNTEVVIDPSVVENSEFRKYSLAQFKFPQRMIKNSEQIIFNWKPALISQKLFYKIARIILKPVVIHESQFTYDSSVLIQAKKNTYLDGFWQTEKYFSDIRTTLLEDFSIKTPLANKNLELADRIKSANSVSIHIRRGDYVTNPKALAHHGICSLDYYSKAIDYISKEVKNPVFFIFSDDMPWVKENLKITFPVFYVDNNTEDNGFEDLRLMSFCKHNIIANSSFSWWGAWLNTNASKIVISPNKWFLNPSMNYSDIVPSNWIKL